MTPQELVDELCDAVDNDDMCYRSYLVCEVEDLCAENAKLREELSKWERLTAGIDLPEYPVTQFKPKDLERENAKLRELLVGAFEDMNAWQKVIACSNEWGYGKGCLDRLCELRDAMQELGMKVVVG